MKDEAVSPVVAFMLLLMIIVSFIAVLNAYYIPSLKQQAEIQHLHSVEESFSKISSNILQELTIRQNITLKEPVEMGGGDVLLSPLRSSGYLEVNTRKIPLSSICISVNSNQVIQSNVSSTTIWYRPVGNFWMNQGYEWMDGVLNITKGNRRTYLEFTDEADAKAADERHTYFEMFKPQIDLNRYPSSLRIDLVQTGYTSANRSVNSNGGGSIWVEMKESPLSQSIPLQSGDTISFQFTGIDEDTFGFKSAINNTFSEWSNNNQTIWDSNNYILNIVNNSQNEYPVLNLHLWNFSCNPM